MTKYYFTTTLTLLILSFTTFGQHVCTGGIKFKLADSTGTIVNKEHVLNGEYEIFLKMGQGVVSQEFEVDSLNFISTKRYNIEPDGCHEWSILILHNTDSMYIYYPMLFSNSLFALNDTLGLDLVIDFKSGNYLLLMNDYQFYQDGNPRIHQMIPLDEEQPYPLSEILLNIKVEERKESFFQSEYFINREK